MTGVRDLLGSWLSLDSPLVIRWGKLSFSAKKRASFYLKLATLIQNGERIQNALEVLRERASRRSKYNPLAIVYRDILFQLRQGKSLGDALMGYAPESEVMLIQAGESNLVDVLRLTVTLNKKSAQIKKAIMPAITGPLVQLVLIVMTLLAVGLGVVPKLGTVLPPEKWSGDAASLYTLSKMVQGWGFYVSLALFAAALVAVFLSMPKITGPVRLHLDKVPPWSFFRMMTGGTWLLSMSALLRAGVPLTPALTSMRRYASAYLDERLEILLTEVRRGAGFGPALVATGLNFPEQEIVEDLEIYSESPNFDELLFEVTMEWLDELSIRVENSAKGIGSIGKFVMYGIIFWVVAGIMAVQDQVQNAAKSGLM